MLLRTLWGTVATHLPLSDCMQTTGNKTLPADVIIISLYKVNKLLTVMGSTHNDARQSQK